MKHYYCRDSQVQLTVHRPMDWMLSVFPHSKLVVDELQKQRSKQNYCYQYKQVQTSTSQSTSATDLFLIEIVLALWVEVQTKLKSVESSTNDRYLIMSSK